MLVFFAARGHSPLSFGRLLQPRGHYLVIANLLCVCFLKGREVCTFSGTDLNQETSHTVVTPYLD